MHLGNWSHCAVSGGSARVYERSLGFTELSFYYDGLFSGTSDSIRHATIETLENRGVHLFVEHNVFRAWIALKQQYPLLGSQIKIDRDTSGAKFVVCETDLRVCRPCEVIFHNIESPLAVQEHIQDGLHGERRLSDRILAQLHIFRRLDIPNHVHVVFHVAHTITDGMSNMAILRTFLDLICTPNSTVPVLEDRLSMAIASEALEPELRLSIARRRWRRAIGHVVKDLRWAKMKGGHTLPSKGNCMGLPRPARSYKMMSELSPATSKRVIASCRKRGFTFGNTLPIIAQVALVRVLCRQYTSGCISQEEWENRKKQPMYTGGPLNLRPYLNKRWLEDGGASTVGLAIGFFWYILPFMPLGSASSLSYGDQLPTYQVLLSRKRFWYRSQLVRMQSNRTLMHPLFLDIVKEQARDRMDRMKNVFERLDTQLNDLSDSSISHPILSFTGSSLGNVEGSMPMQYPATSTPPWLRIISDETLLRCRPGELYLGAATARNQLLFTVFWDGNVYEESLVHEWLNEVRNATLWYLDQEDGEMMHKL